MKKSTIADWDVVIIGAGAAGLAAADVARHHQLSYVLIEASARIGGRAHTDFLSPDCPIDLGCHYLHSASINPFVDIAHRLGFTLQTYPQIEHYYHRDRPLSPQERNNYEQYEEQCHERFSESVRQGHDVSLTKLIDHSSPFAPFYKYYLSLMHSKNPDDVSVFDAVLYNETNEDWLIKEGFGALIIRYGSDIPVSLNCPVTAIDWNGKSVCVRTAKGDIRATAAIITASTDALGDIKFSPALPQSKQYALDALPMGNYKHFYGELTDGMLADNNGGFDILQFATGQELYFNVRPFDIPYIEVSVAGSTADELDKSSAAAQHDFFIDACRHTFGAETVKKLGRFATSQWRKNQWVQGGYAVARPGYGNSRFELAKPLSQMIYFAGEATSPNCYNSAHGAYLSGQRAVQEFITDHGKTKDSADSQV